jgi:aquaporin Z
LSQSLARHWPEYLMEAAGLGLFMVSACLFGTLLEYPGSPVRQAIADPLARRALMGVAMGLTAIGIIYSPWGKQSGAHINPGITLTFFRLGKIAPPDALFYIGAQFVGALLGVWLVATAVGPRLAHPAVNYVVTAPGSPGVGVAFLAEVIISFGLMLTVLVATNRASLARFTGVLAGVLVAIYITVEAPFSGMSMNPARSFGSALPASAWNVLWLYFIAPPVGMLLAAEVYTRAGGIRAVYCAKLHHQNQKRCIFNCRYHEMPTAKHTDPAE